MSSENDVKSIFDNTLKKIKDTQQKAYDDAANTDDVKSGKCTADDERHEPGYVMFQKILEVTKGIIATPELEKLVKSMIEPDTEVPKDQFVKQIVEVLALMVSQATFLSMLEYDDLLKDELTRQLNNVGDHINKLNADSIGMKHAIENIRDRKVKVSDIDDLAVLKADIDKHDAEIQVLRQKLDNMIHKYQIDQMIV